MPKPRVFGCWPRLSAVNALKPARVSWSVYVLLTALVGTVGPCQAQIAIGVSAPLTGPFSPYGRQVMQGARAAIDAVNLQGGIKGKKLEAIIKDDQCNPALGAMEARQLVEQSKVTALIGYPCSSVAAAARGVAQQFDLLLITFGTAAQLTAGPDRLVLRAIGQESRLAVTVADYINVNFGERSIGIQFSSGNSAFNNAFTNTLKSRDALKQTETSAPGSPAPPTWANAVDVLVTPYQITMPPWVVPLARQNPRLTIIVPMTVVPNDPTKLLEGLKNIVIISNPGPAFFPGATAVLNRLALESSDKFGYFLYAYAAIQIFADSANRASDLSGHGLLNAAERQEGNSTVLGQIRFDEGGELVAWRFAAIREGSGPDVCKSPQCARYEQCPRDCPK